MGVNNIMHSWNSGCTDEAGISWRLSRMLGLSKVCAWWASRLFWIICSDRECLFQSPPRLPAVHSWHLLFLAALTELNLASPPSPLWILLLVLGTPQIMVLTRHNKPLNIWRQVSQRSSVGAIASTCESSVKLQVGWAPGGHTQTGVSPGGG